MKTTKTRIGTKTITLKPFEDMVHYQTMVEFQRRGLTVGAWLLKKSAQSPYLLTFGFECPGIHSFLSSDKLAQVFDRLEAGVKDFPPHERVTFHLGAYKSDRQRQEHLQQLTDQAPADELRFLLLGERQRVRQLSAEGLREPKTLHIFVTYRSHHHSPHTDWLDRMAARLAALWGQLSGQGKHRRQASLRNTLRRGWGDGFVHWKQVLETKLEFRVRPLSAQEMWNYLWGRFNASDPIAVPQKLLVTEKGLQEEIHSPRHGATLLLADGEPRLDRQWVRLPSGQYLGVLAFWDKPGGWRDKQHQLHYLWEVVARDLVTDTEIITQVVPADTELVKLSTRTLTKQSHGQAKRREKFNEIDVGAALKAKGGVEAQERLLSGEVPFHTAVLFLVRRNQLEDLEEACRYIENCFHRPAWVVRERQMAWKLWLQSLPIVDENLLAMPFIQRRQLYLSSELPGLLPLVKTHSRDQEGLELIGEDGGTPLFIDLFSTGNDKHRHLGIFGTTRSGKSVLVAGILTQALARDIPAVAIDYPKPDGTSTYTTYTWFMAERGAYFDVGKESVNLFDRPNLSRLSPEVREERFEDYKDFLCSCLQVMVVGESEDLLLNQTVRTILYQTLNRFFGDQTITQLYQAAEEGGLHSPDWRQMPTLVDFLAYFRQLVAEDFFENLRPTSLRAGRDRRERKERGERGDGGATSLDSPHSPHLPPSPTGATSVLNRALEQVGLRLQYWTESRVGRAISSPSSVETSAALMVMALRQISENEDAAVLSLVAYAAALRRAMAYPVSLFFIDESPILFKFPSVVSLVASIISNGAKSGVRVILSAQDPNTIFNSRHGQQIFQNINTKLIGRIQPTATPSFVEILGYHPELVSRCANFFPKRLGLFYTNWLLDDNGTLTFCRFYVPPVLLALVANNTDEQGWRERFLAAFPDKYEAISQFAQALSQSIQSDVPLDTVASLPNLKSKI